ncbi:MAG TPA: alpha/beta hydrolase [Cytophagaceae bacterium]|jgi:pimeloyl-ACP methyl ester carboxylesterase
MMITDGDAEVGIPGKKDWEVKTRTKNFGCFNYLKKINFVILAIILWLSGKDATAQNMKESVIYGSNAAAGKYARINNDNLYYETYGKGEPLILLHGGLSSIGDFKSIIPVLAKEYKVIALDTRGYGRSANNLDSLSYDLIANDVIKLMDHLGIQKFRALGFSDGGVVGLILAGKYASRTLKVVASGANYLVDGIDDVESIKEGMKLENIKTGEFWTGLKKDYEKLSPQKEKFYHHVQLVRNMWLKDPYITLDTLKNIKGDVFLMYGDKDFVKLDHIVKLYSVLECKKQLLVVPGGDHFILMSKTEMVAPLIINFLK